MNERRISFSWENLDYPEKRLSGIGHHNIWPLVYFEWKRIPWVYVWNFFTMWPIHAYDSEGNFYIGEEKINSLDINSLSIYHNPYYLSDKNGSYYFSPWEWENIEKITSKNLLYAFEKNQDSGFMHDWEKIYLHWKRIYWVDPLKISFYYDDYISDYYNDDTNVYYGMKKIDNADKETFNLNSLLNDPERDAEDKNHKYLRGEIIEVKN